MLAPSIREAVLRVDSSVRYSSRSGVGCGDKTQYLPFGEEGRNRVRETKHLFLIAFLDANTACPAVRRAPWGWLPCSGAYVSGVITQHSTPKISPGLTLKLPPIHRHRTHLLPSKCFPFECSSQFCIFIQVLVSHLSNIYL